jgi:hypothetical protein
MFSTGLGIIGVTGLGSVAVKQQAHRASDPAVHPFAVFQPLPFGDICPAKLPKESVGFFAERALLLTLFDPFI